MDSSDDSSVGGSDEERDAEDEADEETARTALLSPTSAAAPRLPDPTALVSRSITPGISGSAPQSPAEHIDLPDLPAPKQVGRLFQCNFRSIGLYWSGNQLLVTSELKI